MLSSGRGCSQILFLGILSRHVPSITLRLQRGWVRPALRLSGQTCFPDVLPGAYKAKNVALLEIRWKYWKVENISYIRCVHMP